MESRGAENVVGALPERLRVRLARAEDAAWVTAANGEIVFWNRAAEMALGYGAREVVGRRCADVLTGDDGQGRQVCGGCDSVRLTTADAFDHVFGMPTRAKDGRSVWLDVTALALTHRSGNGSAPFVVHIFHDVTRTKELLRDLRGHRAPPPPCDARLTPRELEVLRVMADGLGTGAAAERLRVSRATIRNHVQSIFGKLGVHTRLEAVLHATRRRLV